MGDKSAERRKHARTVKSNGQTLADEEGAPRQQNSSHRWAYSKRLNLRYEIILGATGCVCACDDQQGRGGICKHVVSMALERVWHSVKNAKRRMKHVRTPKIRCHDKKCRSECCKRHGTCPRRRQRCLCKKCNRTFSGTPGFKGRHFFSQNDSPRP